MTALLEGLLHFSLTLKDITGITTDAASVMTRLGKLLQDVGFLN